MMKINTMTAALATVLLSMSVAQASEFDGYYAGAKAGMNKSDITGVATATKQNSTTVGLEGGYNWDMGGFLLGGSAFADFNQKANHTTNAVPAAANIGSKTLGLDLKLGLPTGNFLPYAKLGWNRTTGTGANPAPQFKYTNDFHAGLGLEYKLANDWSVLGEWTRSASKIAGSTLSNNNFTLGVNYYFGSPVAAAPVAAVVAVPVVPATREIVIAPPVAAPVAAPVVTPIPAPVAAPAPASAVWKTLLSEKPVSLKGTNFDFNSAKLLPAADAKLNEVADFAANYKDAKLNVSGHTDSVGNDAFNQKLSERRAAAVKEALIKRGIEADRIVTEGFGEAKPVADNKSKAGRAENRRVEIRSVIKESTKVRVNN